MLSAGKDKNVLGLCDIIHFFILLLFRSSFVQFPQMVRPLIVESLYAFHAYVLYLHFMTSFQAHVDNYSVDMLPYEG